MRWVADLKGASPGGRPHDQADLARVRPSCHPRTVVAGAKSLVRFAVVETKPRTWPALFLGEEEAGL
jgi:hypothetical protein